MRKVRLLLMALAILPCLFGVSRGEVELGSAGASAGFGFVTSERWGVTGGRIDNDTDEPVELLVSVNFPASPESVNNIANVQFAYRAWVPAKATRDVLIPIRAPELKRDARGIDIEVKLIDDSGVKDIVVGGRQKGLLRIVQREPNLSTMVVDEATMKLVSDTRKGMGLELGLSHPSPARLPWLTAAWRGIDCLIVGREDLDLDAVQMQAMRQWLISGGRLWVMLEQTDPQFIRDLVGNDVQLEVIDRVEMDTFPLDDRSSSASQAVSSNDNVFPAGNFSPIDKKTKLPESWKLVEGNAKSVQPRGAGLQITLKEGEAYSLESVMPLKSQWQSLQFSNRILLQNLKSETGKASLKIELLGRGDKVLATPLNGSYDKQRGWITVNEQFDIPTGALTMRVTIGTKAGTGAMQFGTLVMQPMGLAFDEPVEMVRVLAPDMEVLREINGWPAAMHQSVGQGQLYITTVGAPFWLAEAAAGRPGMEDVMRPFVRRKMTPALASEQLAPFAHEQIGHRIMSREPVMGLLIAYAVLLLVVGFFFLRKDRLEYGALLGVAMAVLCCLALVAMGAIKRNETPLTLSSAQFVQVLPTQQQAVVSGVVKVYSPRQDMGPLSATAGGVVWPDRTGQEGKDLRMEWTDIHRWRWNFLELPSGAVRTSDLEHVANLKLPVSVNVDFVDGKLVGKIESGPFRQIEDAILAGPNGNLTPTFTTDDTFEIQDGAELARTQFFRGTSLTDTQQRRQEVYRDLILREEMEVAVQRARFPMVASLVWWSQTMDLGFALPQETEHRESAVVAVPLTFNKPAKGAKVNLPGGLIPYVVVRGVGEEVATSVYRPDEGFWAANNMSAKQEFILRFDLPRTLMPMQIEKLTLNADLDARGRKVRIVDPFTRQTIKELDSPGGNNQIDLTDNNRLHPKDDGYVYVKISIDDTDDPTATGNFWTINAFSLDVQGVAK